MSLSELKTLYDPQELKTDLPVILITINKNYQDLKNKIKHGLIDPKDREKEIYQRTCGDCVVGKQREKAQYAVAVYRGWTLAAYKIQGWFASQGRQGRWYFKGEILPPSSPIYQELVDKLTYSENKEYKGAANPISYRNCE